MKTGFINGCFDVLHIGHIRLFAHCKSKCKYLIVAIDSDSRVKKNKGKDRPFNSLKDRKEMLESIKYIDEVKTFSSDQGLVEIIKAISPDIMIVGTEYKEKKVIGSQYAKNLEFFDRVGKYSTTNILKKKLK